MRLVDADALEELFREVIGGIAKKQEMTGALEHMVRASAMVVEMINDAPTVDAVPVRHGHWIRHENADIVDGYLVPKFECSECHSWKEDDSDYCPDCGAKLDGKDSGNAKGTIQEEQS